MDPFAKAAQYQMEGRLDDAKRIYQKILKRVPRHFGALSNLGVLAFSQRDLETARTMLERAAAHPDHNAVCHGVLAATHLLLGAMQQSQEEFARAVGLDPTSAEPFYFVGAALKERGALVDAIFCLEQAVRINPAHRSARNDLGVALLDAGRLDEARACFEQVGGAVGLANLAHVCRAQGAWETGVKYLREAIGLAPADAKLWSNLAAFLQADRRYVEASECAGRAVRLDVGSAEAWVALGSAQCFLGRHDQAAEAFAWAASLGSSRGELQQNLLFMRHYCAGVTPYEHAAEHCRWAERFAPPPTNRIFANPPDPARRLRVGYISADLRAHPVGYALAPVLEAHDRQAVEAVCYASGAQDAWTERIRKAAALWRTTGCLDDAQLERQIVEDGIDILIDLSGHTPGNRLTVFARKPAPVQATWLGYFNTTGLTAMEYLIADPVLAPPGENAPFLEKALRIDGCRFAWELPADLPEVGPAPCLARGFPTYGCFHKPARVGLGVVEAWAEVLKSNPDARLVMKNRAFADDACRAVYRSHFERCGIAAERVDLLGPSDYDGYLRALGEVDLALDPFPFTGGATTCDALAMGVPVITLRGDRFVGRLGAGILQNAGLPDLIAESPAEYVRKAVELGHDPGRLTQLRAEMRGLLAGSVLCDVAGFTKKLEALYREIWVKWCGRATAA